MKANIVAIGNSQGIRIPKLLLDQSGLRGEVDLEVVELGLLIKRSKRPRAGWDDSFKQMAVNNDDDPVLEVQISDKTRENWRW